MVVVITNKQYAQESLNLVSGYAKKFSDDNDAIEKYLSYMVSNNQEFRNLSNAKNKEEKNNKSNNEGNI